MKSCATNCDWNWLEIEEKCEIYIDINRFLEILPPSIFYYKAKKREYSVLMAIWS